jgi:rod shape-determining protein MreD
MRWATYIVLAAVLLTMQSALAPAVEIRGVRPDWLLVGAVFLGLYVPARHAITAAWVLGLCADLLTVERPGLISFSYMLVAAAVCSVREYVFRYWALTQFTLTLVLALCVQTAWMMYRRTMYGPVQPLWSDWFFGAAMTSLYTAAWAPILHRALLALSGLLGIARPRYSHTGLRSVGSSNV